uniref:Transmembrane protein n=1 Tax=Ixodes scapularis TaxID=6945 RepID=A0A4D5RFC1_IXOSC
MFRAAPKWLVGIPLFLVLAYLEHVFLFCVRLSLNKVILCSAIPIFFLFVITFTFSNDRLCEWYSVKLLTPTAVMYQHVDGLGGSNLQKGDLSASLRDNFSFDKCAANSPQSLQGCRHAVAPTQSHTDFRWKQQVLALLTGRSLLSYCLYAPVSASQFARA